MHLVAEYHGLEAPLSPSERPPAGHHLSHWSLGPQTEIESSAGVGAAPGHTPDHPIAITPPGDLEAGNRPRHGLFTEELNH
jgi:hypothetical protein